MPDEMCFFIYLLENYAEYKKSSADRILKRWDLLQVTDKIYKMHWRYHSERIENAFDDIDEIMREKETVCKNI